MRPLTVEGVVENGQIKLKDGVKLPDNTKVYVVVPGQEELRPSHFVSPRLAHPQQGKDFRLEVIGERG